MSVASPPVSRDEPCTHFSRLPLSVLENDIEEFILRHSGSLKKEGILSHTLRQMPGDITLVEFVRSRW